MDDKMKSNLQKKPQNKTKIPQKAIISSDLLKKLKS